MPSNPLDLAVQRLSDKFRQKAVFLVGCRARNAGYEWCYYDVVIYPFDGEKAFFDESKKVVLIPVSKPQSFPRSSTELLNDYGFYYAQAVSDDERFFKIAAREALIRAADYLVDRSRLGELATRMATLNVAKAIVILKGLEPSPSHLYDILSEVGGELAGRAIELLNLTENLGMLSYRSRFIQQLLPGVDAEIFKNNLSELAKRWPIKASLYLLTAIDRIGKERLVDLAEELRFGASTEKESVEAFSLLKTVAALI